MTSNRWTEQEVRGLGVRTDLRTALEVIGIGSAVGYQLAARDELPFSVLRVGRKYVVPVRGLLSALGITQDDGSS